MFVLLKAFTSNNITKLLHLFSDAIKENLSGYYK